MSPASTVLVTVRHVEQTALGHLLLTLEEDRGTCYAALADPHPLIADGQRIYAVLTPLPRSVTRVRWHLLWCRSELMPSDRFPLLLDFDAKRARPKD